MIDMSRKPTPQALRWFGLIVLVFFAVVATVVYFRWRAHGFAYAAIGIGALLSLLFYSVRPLRMPLYLAWMRIFFPLGWLVSHAIVAVIYYLVLTPIGLVLRLVGYDPMRRRFDRRAGSYWVELRRDADLSQYFRQY